MVFMMSFSPYGMLHVKLRIAVCPGPKVPSVMPAPVRSPTVNVPAGHAVTCDGDGICGGGNRDCCPPCQSRLRPWRNWTVVGHSHGVVVVVPEVEGTPMRGAALSFATTRSASRVTVIFEVFDFTACCRIIGVQTGFSSPAETGKCRCRHCIVRHAYRQIDRSSRSASILLIGGNLFTASPNHHRRSSRTRLEIAGIRGGLRHGNGNRHSGAGVEDGHCNAIVVSAAASASL